MADDIKTVVILGMHRSGTSMVANIIQELGVDIGDDFVGGKNPFNPKGHFENRDFLGLNVDILALSNGRWSMPPEREEIMKLADALEPRIKKAIADNQSEIWGWKDPRTTLTIDLYLPHLENPHFLVCYRSKENIGRSISNRARLVTDEDVPEMLGVILTELYNDRIERFFERNPELPRLNLPYENVLASPKKWVEKTADFLGVETRQEAVDVVLTPREKKKLKEQLMKRANE